MSNDKILTQTTKQADSTQIIDLNPYTEPKYCEHHKLFYRSKECVLCKEEERERIFIENFETKQEHEKRMKAKNNSKTWHENNKKKVQENIDTV
jgi:hypothetical protein